MNYTVDIIIIQKAMEFCPGKKQFTTVKLYLDALKTFLTTNRTVLSKQEKQNIYTRRWLARNPIKAKERREKTKNYRNEYYKKYRERRSYINTYRQRTIEYVKIYDHEW